MVRAQIEIRLRTGQMITVGFPDDEAVNAVVERLKRTLQDEKGIFTIDMKVPDSGVCIVHYLPSREIVGFSVVQAPRVATAL